MLSKRHMVRRDHSPGWTSTNWRPEPYRRVEVMHKSCAQTAWAPISACGAMLLILAGCSTSVPVSVPLPLPTLAQQAGYTARTYGPRPTLRAGNDTEHTALLYLWSFFGQATPSDAIVNGDGSITLLGTGPSSGQVASAAVAANAELFQGVAFGGGAYFEATLKFDGWQGQYSNPNSQSTGWPAFWSMSIEHLAQVSLGADQWPGQAAGYEHFSEMDFFEYDLAYGQKTDDVYGGSLHDFYGEFDQTSPCEGFCNIQNPYYTKIEQVPANTDFSAYHTYGMLWVPATATKDGYAQWYFDGEAVGQPVTWAQFTDQSPEATPANQDFGIADSQHLVVILGTGTQYPMTVSAISVWQKSADDNIVGQ
jgi:hypothetical protein